MRAELNIGTQWYLKYPLQHVDTIFYFQLSLRENPLVVRFVSEMTYNPASLLELSARIIKMHSVPFSSEDIPITLHNYLRSAHHCVNPNCRGNNPVVEAVPTVAICQNNVINAVCAILILSMYKVDQKCRLAIVGNRSKNKHILAKEIAFCVVAW